MKDNSVDLICSISELASLFENYRDLNQFLQTVAETIANQMKTSVCSIYLYNDTEDKLVLQATIGLEKFAIGKVALKPGEGITGTAFKLEIPIKEAKATDNPHFKHIPGILEETYEAFLAVPIILGESKVGVIVVQDTASDLFDDNDVKVLKAIATQLATTIENAKLLMNLNQQVALKTKIDTTRKNWLKGEIAAPGIAFGNAMVYCSCDIDTFLKNKNLGKIPDLEDFQRALQETENQLIELQKEVAEKLSDVASLIFSAHLLILKDSGFSGEMVKKINSGKPAHEAILAVLNQYITIFANHPNHRFKEKVHDIKDLGQRLLYNLFEHDPEHSNYKGRIIIADDILPSDILKIAAQKAEGLVMINSTVTAHVSILIKSLDLPAIIVYQDNLLDVDPETFLIIDAIQGNLYINPGKAVTEEFQKQKQTLEKQEWEEYNVREKTTTEDGVDITLLANINLLNDLVIAGKFNASGIGLYRSEFPFIVRNDFPSEEEQYLIYKKIIDFMGEKPVIFRTLDIGGDKMLSFFPHIKESNPFLGMRAIRFSLKNKDIFATQIRAILRAGENNRIKIMFPLISSVDDFIKAKEIVYDCIKALKKEGTSFCNSPQLGVMIELPSAVTIIKELAEEADFLSIGSNDLIQYMLAVDRTNLHLTDYYQPHHPAVLRTLKKVVRAADKANIPVSLCGDMATDEKLLPFLIGAGLRIFSIDPRQIPRVQNILENIHSGEAGKLTNRVLKLGIIKDVERVLGINKP